LINATRGLGHEVAARQILRAPRFVLVAVDEPLHLARRPAVFVQFQLAQHASDESKLVVAVDDFKRLRQARFRIMHAQQTVA